MAQTVEFSCSHNLRTQVQALMQLGCFTSVGAVPQVFLLSASVFLLFTFCQKKMGKLYARNQVPAIRKNKGNHFGFQSFPFDVLGVQGSNAADSHQVSGQKVRPKDKLSGLRGNDSGGSRSLVCVS